MIRSTALFALLLSLMLAGETSAAPLEIKQVAANAKWLAHVDVDAVRASTVVQRAWKKGLDRHKDAETKLGVVRTMLGMDPTKDIHGMTFYGVQPGKPGGVAIIAATMNSDRIIGLAAAIPGRKTTKHGDRDVHSWEMHSKTIAAAFHGKDLLVIGDSADQVGAALDVIDGHSAGLAADAPLAGNIPVGTTFLLRAQGIADAQLRCKAPVVKQIESLRMVTGEHDGTSFFRVRLNMTNPEVTELGLQAVKGWQAQGNLLCPDELGRKFINAVNPKANGQTLMLLWSASADDVWQGMQQMEQAIAKHMARRKHHGQPGDCPMCRMCQDGQCPLCANHDTDCKCATCTSAPSGAAKKAVPPEEDF